MAKSANSTRLYHIKVKTFVRYKLFYTIKYRYDHKKFHHTLYSVSFVISTLLIMYISLKNASNSSLVVVTDVEGASHTKRIKINAETIVKDKKNKFS